MRTQSRQSPRHSRNEKRAGKKERPARPLTKDKQKLPTLGRTFRVGAITGAVLYALSCAALIGLPVAYTWQSVEVSATVANVSGGALYGDYYVKSSPFIWLALFLEDAGVKPRRMPWQPSGVDYGNTSIPATAPGERIYMAWQNMPRSLSAVPPGVNVLAPVWFFVESVGDAITVDDLGHVGGKTSSWNPVQYVSTAHAGGAEVWGVVQSFKPAQTKQIVTDTAARSSFISRIAGWVQQYKLDGIDFDFENMDPADEDEYTALIADCKQALPAGIIVSVVVTVPLDTPDPGNWWQSYDRAGLGKAADYIAVMTYDKADLQPLAGIGWVSKKVKAMLSMVPAEKLLLGVPFYGEDFRTGVHVDGTLSELPADLGKSKSSLEITPSVVQSLLNKGYYTSKGKKIQAVSWVEKGAWSDELAMTRYSFVDQDGYLHVLYCDDVPSLVVKGGLTAFDRLGGVAVWEMGYGSDPMWEALSDGMTAAK